MLFLYRHFIRHSLSLHVTNQSNKKEIASYVKLKIQPHNADTLGWWRNNCDLVALANASGF